MCDTVAIIEDKQNGAVSLVVSCGCGASSVVLDVLNIPPFTRQVVTSLLGTLPRHGGAVSGAVGYRVACAGCAPDRFGS